MAELKRAGLRDYYEFNLPKSKAPRAVGPVALRLKDADAKRHKFNVVLVVDDIEIEKKDRTLLEPVQFYRKGSRQLNEIVVYAVKKNQISGYVSTPKPPEKAKAAEVLKPVEMTKASVLKPVEMTKASVLKPVEVTKAAEGPKTAEGPKAPEPAASPN